MLRGMKGWGVEREAVEGNYEPGISGLMKGLFGVVGEEAACSRGRTLRWDDGDERCHEEIH